MPNVDAEEKTLSVAKKRGVFTPLLGICQKVQKYIRDSDLE